MWVLIKCNDEVLAETEFPKLKVEVPEGHRLLILNIVLKVHTPGPTSRENQSSFIPLAGKVDENLRKVVLIQGETFQWHLKKGHSTKPSHASHCPPELRALPHKLDSLCPDEPYIKSKEDELKAKNEEIEQKKGQVESMLAHKGSCLNNWPCWSKVFKLSWKE